MNNIIRIGIEEATIALSDKDRLAGFCFGLKIKFMFRSSGLCFDTKNYAAKQLGFNKKDFSRYLSLAFDFGYVRIDTNCYGRRWIVANKIHDSKHYSYKTQENELKKLTMPQLKGLLTKAVISNKINIIDCVLYTHDSTVSGDDLKSIRLARKTESRMLRKPFNDKYSGGYSYNQMMKDTNGTRYQVMKAIKTLRNEHAVQRIVHMTEFNVDPRCCTYNQSYHLSDGSLMIISAKYRTGWLRCSNRYKVLRSQISKSKSGTKQYKIEYRKRKNLAGKKA